MKSMVEERIDASLLILKKSGEAMAKKRSSKAGIASRVREAIAPTVEQMGYVVWDVEFVKEGSELDLVVSIDSPKGIGLSDCEAVTRAINPIIDEMDPIEENYYLEVSSVGVDRVLRTEEHLRFCAGWKVCVGFYAPLGEDYGAFAGLKQVTGILGRLEDGVLTVACGEGELAVPLQECSRVRTVYEQ